MRRKHRNDKNHGKNGYVGGNIRYNRKRLTARMGRARDSKSSKS